jgi:hypothetical protein
MPGPDETKETKIAAEVKEAKQLIKDLTNKACEFLRDEKSAQYFTGSDLKNSVAKIESKGSGELEKEIRKYVEALSPESQKELDNKSIDEFGKAIGRSIVGASKAFDDQSKSNNKSKAKPKSFDQLLVKCFNNFEDVNLSKFSSNKDNVYFTDAIIEKLNNNRDYLNPRKEFNTLQTLGAALVALPVRIDIAGDKKNQELIVALSAGALAKLAGKETPFEVDKRKGVIIPGQVITDVVSAAIEIVNDKEQFKFNSPAEAMGIGRLLGHAIRDDLFKNQDNRDKDPTLKRIVDKALALKPAMILKNKFESKEPTKSDERITSETRSSSPTPTPSPRSSNSR